MPTETEQLRDEIAKLNKRLEEQAKPPAVPHINAAEHNSVVCDLAKVASGEVVVDVPEANQNPFAGKKFGSLEEIAKSGLGEGDKS